MSKAYLIVNFGGPRDQKEIRSFLQELLTDRDVIRLRWPRFCHNLFFSYIAKRRSNKVAHDYATIGGGSPIYRDTEEVARRLRLHLDAPVVTFHRYLVSTHATFIRQIEKLSCSEIVVFPMFPQFSYATTGSIARWLSEHLSQECLHKLRWVKSYPTHPAFVQSTQEGIHSFLKKQHLSQADLFFLFSAHGLPRKFIDEGDIYKSECESSQEAVMRAFSNVPSLLSYQSKFGRGEWLRPYTQDIAANILQYTDRKSILVVPISFTSDHIETLYEIEKLYLSLIESAGAAAYRCPALNLQNHWIEAIASILKEENLISNDLLIRH